MPSLQSLVITDRQATPNNFTLVPIGEIGGVGTVGAADASGVAISQKRLSISRRQSGDRIRVTEKYSFPVMVNETINGVVVPRVARTAYVDITWNFHNTHSEAERKDVLGMVYSAHAPGKVLTEDCIQKDQAIW